MGTVAMHLSERRSFMRWAMGRVTLVGWTIVLLAVAGNLMLGFWRVPSLISNRFSLTEPSPLNLAFWSLKRLYYVLLEPADVVLT